MLSVGGALGGIFVGIVSPAIFNSYIEFPLIIGLSLFSSFYIFDSKNTTTTKQILVSSLPSFVIIFFMTLLNSDFILSKNDEITKTRTFFGVYEIKERSFFKNNTNYEATIFTHGTTLHGAQIKSPEEYIRTPLSYYSKHNPMNFLTHSFKKYNSIEDVGIVGLGTGAMNCFFEDKNIDFYEIDKDVINIAKNNFSYLENCKNNNNFIIGDARIKIQDQKNKKYDILFIDAFSSDAIPVHLLTREAINTYIKKLKENGILVFHISNRYLDLEPVLGNISKSVGLTTKTCQTSNSEDIKEPFYSPSIVTVIGSVNNEIDFLENNCWKKTRTDENNLWTDTYNNFIDYFII
tara:strand:- start:306 stop:1352 length:1047 start_codon:yes stop_codon:yes gene_type:complete